MKNLITRAVVLATLVLIAACGAQPETTPAQTSEPAPAAHPADAFLDRLRQHCGQAFAGRIVTDQPPPAADDPFTGKTLVMHVRACDAQQVEVPFHVGEDRSRTWVLTRTETGLRLKHDHRREDGTADATTMYGGDSASPGSELRQEFPVDAESIALFEAEGRAVSVTNTWAMEIEPGQRFLYELSRPGGRLFQVEFDLSVAVEPPSAHPRR